MKAVGVKFILLTASDPWLGPKGGTSAFASQLLEVFQDKIAVVSLTDDITTVGVWVDRIYKNKVVKYLCIGRYSRALQIIPARVNFLYQLVRNRVKIKELEIKNIFIDSPETIWAISKNRGSICYMFHGLNNPVSNSRFKILQCFGNAFEKLFIYRLKKLKPDCILAASAQIIINNFYARTGFNDKVGKITMFPTRADNNIFYPIDEIAILRKKLEIKSQVIFITVGRLARIKGWALLLEAFALFHSENPDSTLIFVGDGEDRHKIIQQITRLGLIGSVIITGMIQPFKVAKYINISDLCLVGSFREGWSVAMCEILACGKSIVSTNVSGATDMIIEGENGFIVNQRDPKEFYSKMRSALELKNSQKVSIELSKRFWLSNLRNDLESLWNPIKGN